MAAAGRAGEMLPLFAEVCRKSGKDVFCARLSFEQIDRNFFKRIGEKNAGTHFQSTLIFDIELIQVLP